MTCAICLGSIPLENLALVKVCPPRRCLHLPLASGIAARAAPTQWCCPPFV